ncbi:MAG: arginyltransferase [Chromatiales bacterium]|jgi:arginine-tRNA-protein transferase|nr:arginyltransferase [Chromatiales bacterium]MDX9766287.1 arginyltransferase [Ectothiorhodospiraceae bacterium]
MRIQLVDTPPTTCPYLPERVSISRFVDPMTMLDPALYGRLLTQGFRRTGRYVYRPHCPRCSACTPLRVPAGEFVPNRSQRRNWRDNQDLEVAVLPCAYHERHFELYARYVGVRHPGGGMDDPDPEEYWRFIAAAWCDTRLIEFRLDGRVVCVAVTDWLREGLSAVYTFFDPELAARGLGSFAIQWQITAARLHGLPHLYLGYHIADCRKMRYKDRFRPRELLLGGRWQRI